MEGCTNPAMRKLVEFANRQTEIIFKDTTAAKSESVMDVGNDVQVHIYPGRRDEETTMPSAIICCDVCPAAKECRAN